MHRMTSIIAALAIAASPSADVQEALADVRTIPSPATIRYVTVSHLPEQEQAESRIALNYALNAVSRSRVLVQVAWSGSLGRIDLASLAGAKSLPEVTQAWEKLLPAEPYWHLRTEVLNPTTGKKETVSTDGGWTGLEAVSLLRQATGSTVPLVRGDWLALHLTTTLDGGVYYEFAGIPETEAAFFRAHGVDRTTVGALAADTAANLVRSHVTHKSRRITHRQGPLGSVWSTKDTASEDPTRDAIRNPVDYREQKFVYDASEHFAVRANGFWSVAIFDARGNRALAVPQAVASDSHALDGIVQPILSCVRCHTRGGEAALQSFNDDQFPLLTTTAVLKSYVPEVAQRVAELYDPQRLGVRLDRDRFDHNAAVVRATGVDSRQAVEALAATCARYQEHPVTLQVAARECGVEAEAFVQATQASQDPHVLALRAGGETNRKQWESSFAGAMLHVGGQP